MPSDVLGEATLLGRLRVSETLLYERRHAAAGKLQSVVAAIECPQGLLTQSDYLRQITLNMYDPDLFFRIIISYVSKSEVEYSLILIKM